MCREERIIFTSQQAARFRNSCLITFFNKIQKVFLKILQISQESTCVGVFFNNVAGLSPASFLKRGSNTNGFL